MNKVVHNRDKYNEEYNKISSAEFIKEKYKVVLDKVGKHSLQVDKPYHRSGVKIYNINAQWMIDEITMKSLNLTEIQNHSTLNPPKICSTTRRTLIDTFLILVLLKAYLLQLETKLIFEFHLVWTRISFTSSSLNTSTLPTAVCTLNRLVRLPFTRFEIFLFFFKWETFWVVF